MNTRLKLHLLLLASLSLGFPDRAQGTAFTYTGRLNDNGVPVNGRHEFRFTLYDSDDGGNLVAGPLDAGSVEVVNGLFSLRIDFGAGAFVGPARWLEVEVRPVGVGGFKLLTPRQEVTSSPYSIFAVTAGTVANASVAADQLNTSGVAPTSGQILSFDGGNLVWSDPGLTAGPWALNGTDTYYNYGNVGIGTNAPSPGIRLEVNGTTRLAPGGSGGVVQFGTPAGETGMAIFGSNRADIRFDNDTLKLAVGHGGGAPPAANGIAIDRDGFVGVGTLNPYERFTVGGDAVADTKIEVNAGGNSYAAMRFFNSVGSWLWQVTPSNDLPGGRLRLTDEWSGAERISITRAGNVGIGTTTPVAKLQVETAEAARTAVYGVVGSTSSVGVYGSANAASSVGVWGRNPDGLAVYADGNAGQARDKGGFVKAMAYIDPFLPADQYVVRCYNSQLAGNAASTSPCGITVTRTSAGTYYINFGFNVDDRFISLTSQGGYVGQNGLLAGTIAAVAGNQVQVVFSRIGDHQNTDDVRFYIIVY